MAKIVYTGNEPELEVEAGINWWILFHPGEPVEVPDVLAHGALVHGGPGDPDYQCARSGLLDRPDFAPADTTVAPAPEQEG